VGEVAKNTKKASIAAFHGVCPEAVEGKAESCSV
jgi:hypothetical protein